MQYENGDEVEVKDNAVDKWCVKGEFIGYGELYEECAVRLDSGKILMVGKDNIRPASTICEEASFEDLNNAHDELKEKETEINVLSEIVCELKEELKEKDSEIERLKEELNRMNNFRRDLYHNCNDAMEKINTMFNSFIL